VIQFFFVAIVLPALVIMLFALLFALSRVGSPDWIRRIRRGPRAGTLKLWHVMAAVVVAALLLHAFTGPPTEDRLLSLEILALGVLVGFARTWCNEFGFLMGLRDDEFPGRNDKLIWAVVLLALAPFGVWFFRSYRLAHWPGPKFVTVSYAEPDQEPSGRAATQPA